MFDTTKQSWYLRITENAENPAGSQEEGDEANDIKRDRYRSFKGCRSTKDQDQSKNFDSRHDFKVHCLEKCLLAERGRVFISFF